jgi:hypothetical protein
LSKDFSKIVEDLVNIEEDSGKKLVRDLEIQVLDLIDNDSFTEKDLKNFRDRVKDYSPLLTDYVEGYYYWRNQDQELIKNPYQDGVQKALDSLEKYIKASREFDLIYLEAFSIKRYISLKDEVGKITDSEIRKIESFLTSQIDADTNIRTVELLNTVEENSKHIDDESKVLNVVDWCKDRSKESRNSGDYWSERYYLWSAHGILSKLDKDVELEIEDTKNKIIDSWDEELNEREREGSLIISGLVRSAMSECIELIDEKKKKEWLQLRGKHNRSSDEEMTQIERSYSVPLPKSIGDNATVNALVNLNSQKALYSFAFSQTHRCSKDRAELIPTPLQRMMGVNMVTEVGGDIETSAVNYYYMMLLENQNAYFANIIQTCLGENLSKEDFVQILKTADCFEEDEINRFEKVVDHYFKENYSEALHIGIPTLERISIKLLISKGVPATKFVDEDSYTSTLTTLIRKMSDWLPEDYSDYMEFTYTNPEGLNRRNKICHGLTPEGYHRRRKALALIMDILTITVFLRINQMTKEYSNPVEVRTDISELFVLPNPLMKTEFNNTLEEDSE